MTNTLTIIGSGIKFLSHLTAEAKIHIEQADRVLYLVNDPVLKEWLQRANPNTESLDFLYTKFPLRLHCYQAIADYIFETLKKTKNLCVVFYGHPTVFSQPAMYAANQAKTAGFQTKILPGISALDCLFADLLVDPSQGYQSFEATDFLIRKRQFDPTKHLILWQIDIIGMLGHAVTYDNEIGVKLLVEYLTPYYSSHHEVTLYEAAQYPGFEPQINKFPLKSLATIPSSRISTLYIPPCLHS